MLAAPKSRNRHDDQQRDENRDTDAEVDVHGHLHQRIPLTRVSPQPEDT